MNKAMTSKMVIVAMAASFVACQSRDPDQGQDAEIVGRRGASVGSESFIATYLGADFVQGVCINWIPKEKRELVLEHKFRSQGWNSLQYRYSAAFDMEHVCAKSKDIFFVLGKADNGDTVVERWTAIYRADGDPAIAPRMKRTAVYSDSGFDSIEAIGADPEGRFLLVLHGSPRKLVKIQVPSGVVEDVVTQGVLPALATMSMFSPWQHISDGRLWVLTDSTDSLHVLLRDADNDGEFDFTTVLTESEWLAAGYRGPVWLDDFLDDTW